MNATTPERSAWVRQLADPLTRRALLLPPLAAATAVAAWALTPTRWLARERGELALEQRVPARFGDWRQESGGQILVVNPQQQAVLSQLYRQLLTRSFVNARGQRIMLSIAYGDDQRDAMQVHYPEVCYPAQGFQLQSKRDLTLRLGARQIPVRQLETLLGSQRHEPVTYWLVLGDQAVKGGVDKKLAEMRYGLAGVIPDGVLVRLSSIDRDSAAAFALQQDFAEQLAAALDPATARRLYGR